MANYDVELNKHPWYRKMCVCVCVFFFWHPMLVRPAMKRLFFLKAKNGLGRFAPSALPHYNEEIVHEEIIVETLPPQLSIFDSDGY